MKTHFEDSLHFNITVLAALFTFTVNQYATSAVYQTKQRDLSHRDLGDCFIGAGNKWSGQRYVHHRIVITDHDKIFSFFEMLFSFQMDADADKRKKNAHPYS